MRIFQFIIHVILLITTPILLLFPQHDLSALDKREKIKILQGDRQPLSYDDVLELFNDLESGKLEKRCSKGELKKIDRFLVQLSRKGASPVSFQEYLSLENDISNLLNQDGEYYYCNLSENEYQITTAISKNENQFVLCKSSKKSKCYQ